MRLKAMIPAIAGLVFGAIVLRQLLADDDTSVSEFDVDVSGIHKALGISVGKAEYEIEAWVRDTADVFLARHDMSDHLVLTIRVANIIATDMTFQVRIYAAEVGKVCHTSSDFVMDFNTLIVPGRDGALLNYATKLEDRLLQCKRSGTDWGQVRKWKMVQT